MHNTCAERDRLDFLAGMIEREWLTEADLTDEEFLIELADGEDDPAGKASNDERLAEMNRQYATVLMKGSVRILREPPEGQAEVTPDFLSVEAFHQWTANHPPVWVERGGSLVPMPVSKWWMKHEKRRQHDRVVFEPAGAPANAYNLWKGWPTKAVPGDWSLLRDHVHDNVCQGNEEHFKWLMSWMAQIIQQPETKMGTAVVIKGKQGVGKSKLFDWLTNIMGKNRYAVKTAQSSQVVGNFNAHLETAILFVAEEGFFAGDKRAESVLKDLITSDRQMIERKGVDSYMVSNFTRLSITSNHDWVIPASLGDRRYFVLECGEGKIRDTKYFAAIDAQMENGGAEAMLYDLLNWDITQVDLRNPPRTKSLKQQIEGSFSPAEQFVVEFIMNRGLHSEYACDNVHWCESNDEECVFEPEQTRLIIEAYNKAVGRFDTGTRRFNKVMSDMVPGFSSYSTTYRDDSGKPSRGHVLKFPPMTQIAKDFMDRYGIEIDLTE